MVSALFVIKDGPYFGISGVDPWDITRDAMNYTGPHPVIAHPPCARWSRVAPLVQAVHGYKIGDDGGTFGSALLSVRKWGGILEHPAKTMAWDKYGLPVPHRGEWTSVKDGEFVTEVEQRNYGHRATKATWLLVCGYSGVLPPLRWHDSEPAVASLSNRRKSVRGDKARMPPRERLETPLAFKQLLISIAEKCGPT